jgi:hypothetical protein
MRSTERAVMPHTALIEPVGAGQATCRWLYRFEADRTHRAMTMTAQRPLLGDRLGYSADF